VDGDDLTGNGGVFFQILPVFRSVLEAGIWFLDL
jgi:hypothetical protein